MSQRFELDEAPAGFGYDPQWYLDRGRTARIQYRADELEPGEQRIWELKDTRQVIRKLHDVMHAPWVCLIDGQLDNEALYVMRALEESAGHRLVGGGWIHAVGDSDKTRELTPEGFPDIFWHNPNDPEDQLFLHNLVTDLVVLRPSAYHTDDERLQSYIAQSRYIICDQLPSAN